MLLRREEIYIRRYVEEIEIREDEEEAEKRREEREHELPMVRLQADRRDKTENEIKRLY